MPSQEQINEWREHPVTLALRSALEKAHAAKKRAMFDAFYSTGDTMEMDRRTMQAIEEFREDFFDLDEEDLKAAEERYDE